MAKSEERDPLLDELNGNGATVESTPDGPLPAADKTDPLELQPPIPTPAPATEKFEALHAIKSGGKGYAITLRGEYFAQSKDSNAKIRKNYELVFNLPSLDSALGVIVGKLLDPALRKKHLDYVRYRTHEIVDVKPLGNTPESNNIQYMTRPRLVTYIQDNRVPVDPEEYPDLVHLRDAVIDYTLNPKGFEDREAKRQASRREDRELALLNPGIEVATK